MLILLAGCAYKFGAPTVAFGEVEALPLLHTSNNPRWFVPVEVQGEPWLWFVDTGYAWTTCDDDLIDTLNLETGGDLMVRGESGQARGSKANLPPFELGGHRISGLTCVVRDLDRTSSIRDPAEVPIAGVLGMDVLSAFQVTLDPRAGRMVLRPPNSEAIRGVKLRSWPWDPRVRIALTVEGRTIWPTVDTGTTAVYLDGGQLGLTPVNIREDVVVRGTGLGEQVRDIAQYRETLGFAGGSLEDVLLSGRPRTGGVKGLVGLSLLSRYVITWDFPNQRARFVPTDSVNNPLWSTWQTSQQSVLHSRFLSSSPLSKKP